MGTKIKGIRKGFNKYISQIFVVKEEDIQISGPTEVKHVAHIGFDGGSGSNPSWMDTFETRPNFAMTSVGVGASGSSPAPWTSQGSSQDTGGMGKQSKRPEVLVKEEPSTEVPPKPKKQRRKKKKKSTSVSSPRAGGVKTKSRKPRPKLIKGKSPLNIATP